MSFAGIGFLPIDFLLENCGYGRSEYNSVLQVSLLLIANVVSGFSIDARSLPVRNF
jgi:hypothetical protein